MYWNMNCQETTPSIICLLCECWRAHSSWEAAVCGQNPRPTLRLCRHMKGCYVTCHTVQTFTVIHHEGRPRSTFLHLCPPRNVQLCQKTWLYPGRVWPAVLVRKQKCWWTTLRQQRICHGNSIEQSAATAAWQCLFFEAYTFLSLPRANGILNKLQACFFFADAMYLSINSLRYLKKKK